MTVSPVRARPGELAARGRRVIFGRGRIAEVPRLVAEAGARSVFLVTGGSSFALSGAADALAPLLGRGAAFRFEGVRPNPELEQVEDAVARLRARCCDAVVGIGGGSVLDVAKAAAVLAAQPAPPLSYLEGRQLDRPRACRLFLAPTTAGSGSEATRFATVYVAGCKRSLDHPSLLADAAVVDPRLTHSQPPEVAASSGLDALSQAVESYWSCRSTVRSRRLAGRALGLLLDNLTAACRGDDEARSAVSLAALVAGRAIDLTRTTAAHAFAYPLTARFGVPHGLACALNLSWLLPFNCGVTEASAADARGAAFVQARLGKVLSSLGAADGEAARGAVLALVGRLGLSPGLRPFGVHPADVEAVAAEGLASERAANNPRRLSPEAAQAGLSSLL